MKKIIKWPFFFVFSELKFLGRFLFRIFYLFGQLFPSDSRGCKIRGLIFKPFLKKCGKNFQVGLGAKLENVNNLSVGNDVYIGPDSWICAIRGGIKFEDEVMIGPKVSMVSSNHSIIEDSFRFGPGIGKPITIGKGTWIAANCCVMAGVTIGNCCLIAAGSVVTKNVESFSLVGGVPARTIGSSKDKYKVLKKNNLDLK